MFFHYKENEKKMTWTVKYSCHKVQLPLIKTERGRQNMLNNTMETESENLDGGKLKRRNNQFLQQMNCRLKKGEKGDFGWTSVNGCLSKMHEALGSIWNTTETSVVLHDWDLDIWEVEIAWSEVPGHF